MNRVFSFAGVAVGSLAVLAGLVYLLDGGSESPKDGKPLLVYCAAALKPAMQAVAADYERETGVLIEFRFGNSEQVLANAALSREGDLFLPADDSFVRAAEAKGLVAETFPLATMRAVVLTKPGNPHGIARFEDLLQPGLRFGQANPDGAAIGKVTREHLQKSGHWKELADHTLVYHSTVTDAANAVLAGSNDAAIVWDAVAANYPTLSVVHLPELDGAIGNVELAVLRSAGDAAMRLVRFVCSPEHGAPAFRAAGFTNFLTEPPQ
ncbi:MAG TPA: substrate-binding domain-containing protein [Gemmataceae bacterium]|jgi:molybdate transport system substrate-binding protein